MVVKREKFHSLNNIELLKFHPFSVFLAMHFVFPIDGMTKVIHRLESHAVTDQPIKEVKNSLECD